MIRIYRTTTLPVLLYGAEPWTLQNFDLNRLEIFHMQCLRRILGITRYHWDRNESIRKISCDQSTIEEEIQKRRLRWFGPVCRLSEQCLPYQLLWRQRPKHWKVQHTASRNTWSQQIGNDLKNRRLAISDAKEAEADRERWK